MSARSNAQHAEKSARLRENKRTPCLCLCLGCPDSPPNPASHASGRRNVPGQGDVRVARPSTENKDAPAHLTPESQGEFDSGENERKEESGTQPEVARFPLPHATAPRAVRP